MYYVVGGTIYSILKCGAREWKSENIWARPRVLSNDDLHSMRQCYCTGVYCTQFSQPEWLPSVRGFHLGNPSLNELTGAVRSLMKPIDWINENIIYCSTQLTINQVEIQWQILHDKVNNNKLMIRKIANGIRIQCVCQKARRRWSTTNATTTTTKHPTKMRKMIKRIIIMWTC